jgi:hypothetical protein
MSAKYPGPEDDDYDIITLHEAFHIYQLSHITSRDLNLFEEKNGRRSGDHNPNVPWWSKDQRNIWLFFFIRNNLALGLIS